MPLAPLLTHFSQGVLIASRHQLILAAMQAMVDMTPSRAITLSATCAQALQSLKSSAYDLLICTQSLQSGSGIELAKEAKHLYPTLPILFFLTTRSEAAILKEGFLRKTDPGSRTHSLVIKRLDE